MLHANWSAAYTSTIIHTHTTYANVNVVNCTVYSPRTLKGFVYFNRWRNFKCHSLARRRCLTLHVFHSEKKLNKNQEVARRFHFLDGSMVPQSRRVKARSGWSSYLYMWTPVRILRQIPLMLIGQFQFPLNRTESSATCHFMVWNSRNSLYNKTFMQGRAGTNCVSQFQI